MFFFPKNICPFGQKSWMTGETPANPLNGKCLTFFSIFYFLSKVIFHQMYPYVGAASIVQQLTQTYDRRSKTTQQDVREKSKSSLSDSCLSWPSCGARCTWPWSPGRWGGRWGSRGRSPLWQPLQMGWPPCSPPLRWQRASWSKISRRVSEEGFL